MGYETTLTGAGVCQNRWVPSNSQAPSFMSASFNCPHCGALAGQDWVDLMSQPHNGGGLTALVEPRVLALNTGKLYAPSWAASRCFACKRHSIWLDRKLVYPDPSSGTDEAVVPHEDMPQDAAVLFREAASVLPFSRRAAAALCRAAMERLVKTLDPSCPDRAKLDDRLVRLEDRVSSATLQLLHVLRHVGNTALHGERDDDGTATIYIDEDDKTIAETFFLAINTLVDELITRPRRSEELYNALPVGVRESYERKAGRTGGSDPVDTTIADRSS